MLGSLKSHFSHLSWRYNTHSQRANRLGQMSSPFEMELSSWSHGNCDINTWLSQESCHLMRTWSHFWLLPALLLLLAGNSWLLLAAVVVLLRCCGQGTDHPPPPMRKSKVEHFYVYSDPPPITTFYDKTPEFCNLTAIRSLYDTFISLSLTCFHQ